MAAPPGSTLERLRQAAAPPETAPAAPPAVPGSTIERLRARAATPEDAEGAPLQPVQDIAQNFLAAGARAVRPIELVSDWATGMSLPSLSDIVLPKAVNIKPTVERARDFGKGVLKGVAELPALRGVEWALNKAVFKDDPEFHISETINTRNNRATEFGKFVGQVAPEMVMWQLGAKVAQVGAEKMLRSIAPELAKAVGPTVSKMLGGAQQVEGYYASIADPLAAEIAKPALVRATEVIGRSIGSGLLGAAEAPFTLPKRGEPAPDPLHAGLMWGAANLAFEGTLTVGGKLLFKGARETSKEAIISKYVGSTAQAKLLNTTAKLQKRQFRAYATVNEAFNEEAQAKLLAGYYDDLGGAIPVNPQAFVQGRSAALNELGKATADRVNAVRKMHQITGNLAAAKKFSGIRPQDIMAGQYVSETPTNFDSTTGQLHAWLRDKFASTDGVRKELGVVGEYGIRQVANADIVSAVRSEGADEVIRHYGSVALNELGGNRQLFNKAIDVWEAKGGTLEGAAAYLVQQGVTPRAAQKVMGIWDQLQRGKNQLYGIGERMGAEPTMDAAMLDEMGVGNHTAHIPVSGVRDDFLTRRNTIKLLMKRGMSEESATERVINIMEQRAVKAYQRFGSADDQRLIPGTLREKVDAGIPLVADHLDALRMYMSGMHRRIALSQVLGWQGEILKPLTAAVAREAGTGAAAVFRGNIESVAGLKYHSQLGQSFASTVTNLETAAKMGMSWSPNLWQTPLNNPIIYGLGNTLTGVREMVSREMPDNLKRAAGWMATDYFDLGMRENLLQTQRRGVTSKLARFVLDKATPFSLEERYHRLGAALGAHATMTDILQRAAVGKLRGENLVFARRMFNEAGLDLATVLREGISDDQYMVGVVRLMRRSQFAVGVSGRDLRPPAWATPMGRIVTQFNTYALNQGRLMRDYVFNEVARGNYRQLHRFLGFYTPTADVAVSVQNKLASLFTGKERERPKDATARLIEDMIMPGSLGIVTNAYYAARFGVLKKAVGPAISDVADFVDNTLNGNIDRVIETPLKWPSIALFSNIANHLYKGGKVAKDAAEAYQAAWDREEAAADEARRESTAAPLTLRDFREAARQAPQRR